MFCIYPLAHGAYFAHGELGEWGIDFICQPRDKQEGVIKAEKCLKLETAILISEVGDGSATRFLSAAKLHVYDRSLKLRVQRSVTVMAEG